MGLESSFRRLQSELVRLQETVGALHTTVVEDCPCQDETVLVDHLQDAIIELHSKLEEARAHLRSVLHPSGLAGRGGAARATLLLVHRRVSEFARQYRDVLARYDSIDLLCQLGRERGGEWAAWSSVVKEAVERCAAPLDAVQDTIQDCWQEGTEGMVIIGPMSQAPNRAQLVSSTTADTSSKGKTAL